jgi:hypothetical protein
VCDAAEQTFHPWRHTSVHMYIHTHIRIHTYTYTAKELVRDAAEQTFRFLASHTSVHIYIHTYAYAYTAEELVRDAAEQTFRLLTARCLASHIPRESQNTCRALILESLRTCLSPRQRVKTVLQVCYDKLKASAFESPEGQQHASNTHAANEPEKGVNQLSECATRHVMFVGRDQRAGEGDAQEHQDAMRCSNSSGDRSSSSSSSTSSSSGVFVSIESVDSDDNVRERGNTHNNGDANGSFDSNGSSDSLHDDEGHRVRRDSEQGRSRDARCKRVHFNGRRDVGAGRSRMREQICDRERMHRVDKACGWVDFLLTLTATCSTPCVTGFFTTLEAMDVLHMALYAGMVIVCTSTCFVVLCTRL